jgi:hypothetical protein
MSIATRIGTETITPVTSEITINSKIIKYTL